MKFIENLKRGFSRPISMPRWKWCIDYLIWFICLMCYLLSMIGVYLLIIPAIILQGIAITLPYIWDTGNWRNTEMGKKFTKKYEK